jgi:8-oxo-dGTP pyrophosphatase MutT (NUDIX family)
MEDVIYPMAYIVVYEDGKFLMTQRKADADDDPAFDGKWQIPGGGLEIGEHIRTVVQREAKEELGIDVNLKRTLAITEVITHNEHWHRLCLAFLSSRVDPSQPITVNEESYGYGWYSIEEAAKLELMPQTLEIMEYIARNYRLFKIGVLGVIQKGDKFLLTKIHAPGKEKAHSKWSFIMGTCDINESITTTLVREVKEETGLDVSIVKHLSYAIEMYDLKIFSYLVTPVDPDQQVVLNYEASDWGWFTYEEAMKLDLYGDTEKVMNEADEFLHHRISGTISK